MPDWRDTYDKWSDEVVAKYSNTPLVGGLTHLLKLPSHLNQITRSFDDGFQKDDLIQIARAPLKMAGSNSRALLGTLDNTVGLIARPIIKGIDTALSPIAGEGDFAKSLEAGASLLDPGKLVASGNSFYRAAKSGELGDIKWPWQTEGLPDVGVQKTLSELGLSDKIVSKSDLRDLNDAVNAGMLLYTFGGTGAARSIGRSAAKPGLTISKVELGKVVPKAKATSGNINLGTLDRVITPAPADTTRVVKPVPLTSSRSLAQARKPLPRR